MFIRLWMCLCVCVCVCTMFGVRLARRLTLPNRRKKERQDRRTGYFSTFRINDDATVMHVCVCVTAPGQLRPECVILNVVGT